MKDVDPRVFESVLRGRNDMFINSLLVTPNCYRLTEFGEHIAFVSFIILLLWFNIFFRKFFECLCHFCFLCNCIMILVHSFQRMQAQGCTRR